MVTEPAAADLQVRVDQDLCTGDGLCVQYAPEVFEFDVDGLAYVKDSGGQLRLSPGDMVKVPTHLRLEVIDAAAQCPGECIHLHWAADSRQLSEQERDQVRQDLGQPAS